ncbi:hypothetical protein NWFMUON74_01950 [Nocardia wallacei]|uniref:Uncharacterized protein n=1 Tax=Nocardia wallacei TaxID=480035 RepID=A0A7G1KDR2_9NOCA|nr:hypothetical protein NWFMUON74_01950 [Nocardia wallacei]
MTCWAATGQRPAVGGAANTVIGCALTIAPGSDGICAGGVWNPPAGSAAASRASITPAAATTEQAAVNTTAAREAHSRHGEPTRPCCRYIDNSPAAFRRRRRSVPSRIAARNMVPVTADLPDSNTVTGTLAQRGVRSGRHHELAIELMFESE